jgi:hypothetical protein
VEKLKSATPIEAVATRKVIVGAVYNLDNGRVIL